MNNTVLADEQIERIYEELGIPDLLIVARAIEQAVLQSPEVQAWKKDAALGRIAMNFVDRDGDYCKEDPAERICDEFNKSMSDAINAAMEEQP